MNDTAAALRTSLPGVPDLGYTPIPDVFKLPQGMNFGPCSGVAVNSCDPRRRAERPTEQS